MVANRYGLEIFDDLRALGLPASDYAVFGSGPLLIRGIINEVADLDVICRGSAWEAAERLATSETIEHGVRVLSRGGISFGTIWGLGDFAVADLIDDAEWIAGLPFVGLKYVIEYKRIAGRAKDQDHLRLINEWQRAR